MIDTLRLPGHEGISHQIEKLDEVLSDTYSIPSAIRAALKYILSAVNRTSGGLVLAQSRHNEEPEQAWVKPLPAWVDGKQITSSLLKSCMEEVVESGKVGLSADAYIWPVQTNKHVLAVLVLQGKAPDDEEVILLNYLSLIVARKIEFLLTHMVSINRGQFLNLMKLISTNQTVNADINEVELNFARGISDVFNAEMLGLFLPIKGKRDLVERKIFTNKPGWHEIIQMPFDKGLVRQCVTEGKLIQWEDAQKAENFNEELDAASSIEVKSMVCIPLVVDRKTMGAVAIINSPLIPLSYSDRSLVMNLASSLASCIENSTKLHTLSTENSSLELRLMEVANSRDTLRILFDNIPTSIYIIDEQYHIVAVNKARAQRAGTNPRKIFGKLCYEALYDSSQICEGCLAMASIKTGENTNRSSQTWEKNDQITEWEINTYTIFDEHNHPIQVILHEQDITINRRLEANLIQSEKLAAVGQLAAGVAHEINNPLAAVIANAQILKQDISPENEDLMESVKLIELAGLRASHVVKNLLGLARKDEYEFRSLDLNENIQDALSLLSHEFVARPISIRFERSKGIPFIYASGEHLESVWINLIMNAIESIGEMKGEININTFYDEGNFYVLIKDTGSGIPPEHLGHIFEPFYTTKGHARGTGLGLSVVQRIIKAHSGKIQVDSEVGKGTTFTIILPEQKDPKAESLQ